MAMDIEKICRTCLSLSGRIASIYEEDSSGMCIADMLENFTKSRPRRQDKLPQKVCLSCVREIERCYTFKLKCENSCSVLCQLIPDALPVKQEYGEEEVDPPLMHAPEDAADGSEPEGKYSFMVSENDSVEAEIETKRLTRSVSMKEGNYKHQELRRHGSEDKRKHGTEDSKEEGSNELRSKVKAPVCKIKYDKQTSPIEVEQYETSRFNRVKSENASDVEISQEIKVVKNRRIQLINDLRRALSLKQTRFEEEMELKASDIIMEIYKKETEIGENSDATALYSTMHEDSGETNKNTATHYQFTNYQSGNESQERLTKNINSVRESNQVKQETDEYGEEEVYAPLVSAVEDLYDAADEKEPEENYGFMVSKNDGREAEFSTKRIPRSASMQEVNKKTIIKEDLKCSHCSMTFVSAKSLARHELRRHDNEDIRKDSTEHSKKKESASTKTTTKSKTLINNSENSDDSDNFSLNTTTAKPAAANMTSPTTMLPIVEEIKPAKLVHFCDTCGAGFPKKQSLAYHKNQDICNKVTHNCNICGRIFISEKKLKEHKSTHLQKNKCTKCDMIFGTNNKLGEHMVAVHKLKMLKQCTHCNKAFTNLSGLKYHLHVHTGERPFACDICNKGFSQKSYLKIHKMRHSIEKNFKCDECSKSFYTKGDLRYHKRSHTGERPFRCNECKATFTVSSSLANHKRIHTGERPYVCDFCPKRFKDSFSMKTHRRMHTGEQYKCRWCSKAFVSKQYCIRHQSTHADAVRKQTQHFAKE